MIPQFLERLEICRKTKESNCIGTALYLTGLCDSPDYVDPEEAWELIQHRVASTNNPGPGVLCAWYDDGPGHIVHVHHMALITERKDNLIYVVHRPSSGQTLQERVNLKRVAQTHSTCDVAFLEPRR